MLNKFVLAALAGITMISGASAAHAADDTIEQKVSWKMAGVSLHTQISMDRNWPPASMNTGRISGTLGSGMSQGMTEPERVPVSRCPKNATLEYNIIASNNVITLDDGLDQLTYRLKSGYCCMFADNSITAETISEVTGGTGRFKGATGTLVTTVSPEAVSFPEWKGEFNNSISLTEGTLVLLKANQARP